LTLYIQECFLHESNFDYVSSKRLIPHSLNLTLVSTKECQLGFKAQGTWTWTPDFNLTNQIPSQHWHKQPAHLVGTYFPTYLPICILVCTLCSAVLCVISWAVILGFRVCSNWCNWCRISYTFAYYTHSFSARLHMITMMFSPADWKPPPVVVVVVWGGSAGALPPSTPAPLSKTYRYIPMFLQPMLLIVIARELWSLDYMTFIMWVQGWHDSLMVYSSRLRWWCGCNLKVISFFRISYL
jgi:hypothetical protein